MTQTVALLGLTLIDGTGREPLDAAGVVVDGTRIVDVGPQQNLTIDPETRVVDASGLTLLPGIVDVHCHLGGASDVHEDQWVLEHDTYQAIASVAQATAMLHHGVTSVRDVSANGPHLHKAVTAGLIEGPHIVSCWRGLSRTGGHGDAAGVPPALVRTSHPWGIVADGPDEVRKATREIIKNGGQCIKVWASGGGLHEREPEDVQHYTFEELRVIVEEAELARVPVMAHCESDASALDAAIAGVWSIEHGEDLGPETLEIMARQGISLVPTLVLLTKWFSLSSKFGGPYGKPYLPGGGSVPDDQHAAMELLHEQLSANLMAAHRAGVRIGVGSDSFCHSVTPFGVQSLEEVKALVSHGLSEMEAIVAATKSGAEIQQRDDVTGTLEVGKLADLLLLRHNPLDDINRLSEEHMLFIMKAGRIVKNELE